MTAVFTLITSALALNTARAQPKTTVYSCAGMNMAHETPMIVHGNGIAIGGLQFVQQAEQRITEAGTFDVFATDVLQLEISTLRSETILIQLTDKYSDGRAKLSCRLVGSRN